MFFYSHVAPVGNAIPTPGKDMPEAAWRRHIGFPDIALFLFDAKSGQLLDLTGIVVMLPTKGMWLSVFTRYQDGSSFCASNKLPTGLELPPKRRPFIWGLEANAEAVIDCALNERHDGLRRRPSAENLLDDHKKGWKENVDWRRARGTTAEEIKRVDQLRGQPRAIGQVAR
jgi:hypothetical protein